MLRKAQAHQGPERRAREARTNTEKGFEILTGTIAFLADDLEILEDDEDFFPIYNPAPLTNDIIEREPQIREPLNAIGPTLDTESILRLNGLVSLQGRDPQTVAREYLDSEGLI